MGRILAIDYGHKRVGLAVTDPLQLIATPLDTIHSQDLLAYLKAYHLREPLAALVIGMPRTLSNEATDATSAVVGVLRRLRKEFPERAGARNRRAVHLPYGPRRHAGRRAGQERPPRQSHRGQGGGHHHFAIFPRIPMIYPIVAFGDPVLKTLAKPLPADYPAAELELIIANMFETMYHAHGVGLAAPQIGKSIRLFVIDSAPMLDEDEDGNPIVEEPTAAPVKRAFINPVDGERNRRGMGL